MDPAMEKMAGEALSRHTPLDRERALDTLRWQRLEELAGYDPFSARPVLAYALKLQLVERWAELEEDAGMARLEEVVSRPPRVDETEAAMAVGAEQGKATL